MGSEWPQANLVSIKVMNSEGVAKTSDVIAACQWILANKAAYNIRVANFSLHSASKASFLNDPLDKGWHLWPAVVGFKPSFALAQASTVWYAQIVLIVLGHVTAVYLSHLRAGERFRTVQRALLRGREAWRDVLGGVTLILPRRRIRVLVRQERRELLRVEAVQHAQAFAEAARQCGSRECGEPARVGGVSWNVAMDDESVRHAG